MIGTTNDERRFIVRKYLDGGIVRIRNKDKWELVTLQGDGNNDELPVRILAYHPDGSAKTLTWPELDVESFSFEPRLLEANDRVIYLSRNGIHSTQRSVLQRDLTYYSMLGSYILHNLNGRTDEELLFSRHVENLLYADLRGVTGIQKIIQEFCHPTTRTLKEGLTRLELYFDALLNRDFALTISLSEDPRPWIWYQKLPVGKIDNGAIVVGHRDFYQELSDYLNHTHQAKDWALREEG